MEHQIVHEITREIYNNKIFPTPRAAHHFKSVKGLGSAWRVEKLADYYKNGVKKV